MFVVHYRLALPVSLILLLLAAKPLRIPFFVPGPPAVAAGGDTGAPIMAFCFAARMMSLYVTEGETGGSTVDFLVVSTSTVDASSSPLVLRVCVDDVGSGSARKFGRLRFRTRPRDFDMPLRSCVGVLGVLSSADSFSCLVVSSE